MSNPLVIQKHYQITVFKKLWLKFAIDMYKKSMDVLLLQIVAMQYRVFCKKMQSLIDDRKNLDNFQQHKWLFKSDSK